MPNFPKFLMRMALLLAAIWCMAPHALSEPAEDEPLAYEIGVTLSADGARRQAASFIAMDMRFLPVLAREMAQARSAAGFREGYQAARAKGHFDGSEEEYAMLFAVLKMETPFYGAGAQIYCPPNDPTYIVLLRHWRGETIDCQTYDPADRYSRDRVTGRPSGD